MDVAIYMQMIALQLGLHIKMQRLLDPRFSHNPERHSFLNLPSERKKALTIKGEQARQSRPHTFSPGISPWLLIAQQLHLWSLPVFLYYLLHCELKRAPREYGQTSKKLSLKQRALLRFQILNLVSLRNT